MAVPHVKVGGVLPPKPPTSTANESSELTTALAGQQYGTRSNPADQRRSKMSDDTTPNKKFEYKTIPLNKVQLDLVKMEDATPEQRSTAQGSNYLFQGGKMIKSVLIDDEPITPSGRFWSSLYSRFNLNKAFFKFFDHQEVFDRIVDIPTAMLGCWPQLVRTSQ